MDNSVDPKDGFAAHEREQILWKAKNTTAEQRFRWLEEALELFAPYIAQAQLKQPKRYF